MNVVSPNAASYQWFKDGEHVIGETSDTINFTNISSEDEGKYFCRCTNSMGSKDTSVARVEIIDEVFTVSFESKDFSSTQDGSAMRTGFSDALHSGGAGECVPRTFDYNSATYTVKQISANQDDDQIRFIVEDATGLESTSLRLFVGAKMATMTFNGPSNGYLGNNEEVNSIFHSLDGTDSDVTIAIINNGVMQTLLLDGTENGNGTPSSTSENIGETPGKEDNNAGLYTQEELEGYELDQLKAIAKDLNIKSYHTMKEETLIERILGINEE